MKHFLQRSACFFLGLLIHHHAHAQTKFSGKVTGEDNEPLPNATIHINGTNRASFTGADQPTGCSCMLFSSGTWQQGQVILANRNRLALVTSYTYTTTI